MLECIAVTPRFRLLSLLLLMSAHGAHAADVDYLRDIKPLLADKCGVCHGPIRQEGGLRLDAAALIRQGGDSGPAVLRDTPLDSQLLQRVTSPAPEDRMPPPGEGSPLKPEQVELLQNWIAAGLPAPENEEIVASPQAHWAYRPIVRPRLPEGTTPAANPIDRFVDSELLDRQLDPYPAADPGTLLRRVTLDLIGIPPTVAQLQEFLDDPSEAEYRRIVDQLLEAPQHGERWARHWMDVWRYSDWDGYKNQLRGSQRHIWRWRDWIVEALNQGKPYDRMIVEMLAGDEIAPGNPQILRATGFLARNYHNSNRNIWLDATVEHTAKAFLAMTINCARCHEHKFDPIAQQEYYAMRAIFEPHQTRTDRVPGQRNPAQDGLARVYDADLTAQTFLYIGGNEKNADEENPLAPNVPELLGLPFEVEPVPLPPMAYFPALADFIHSEDLAAAEKQLRDARQALQKLQTAINGPPQEGASIRSGLPPSPEIAHQISQEVQLAELKFDAAESGLAGLTARTAADRAKHLNAENLSPEQISDLAGRATAAEQDHNIRSARLRVFELWTAREAALQSTEKDQAKRQAALENANKELANARSALMKAEAAGEQADATYTPVGTEYPRTSSGRRLALAKWIADPRNPLTARVAVNHIWLRHFGAPLVESVFDFGMRAPRPVQLDLLNWLAAEFMDSGWNMKHLHRLIVTSVAYRRASSGQTALAAHNAEIDPENRTLWRANVRRLDAEVVRDSLLAVAGKLDLTLGGQEIEHAKGETTFRRSLYFGHAYEKQMQMLVIFDAASPNECYRRSESIIPQQALALANSPLSISMSRTLARRLYREHPAPPSFIERAFLTVLNRPPQADERAACESFLQQQSARLARTAELSKFNSAAEAQVKPADDPALRARENLIHVLLNHNDFVTQR